MGETTDSIELCPEDDFLTYSDVNKRCGCGSARFYNPSLRSCNKRKTYNIYNIKSYPKLIICNCLYSPSSNSY